MPKQKKPKILQNLKSNKNSNWAKEKLRELQNREKEINEWKKRISKK